jgi:hypothetical protein
MNCTTSSVESERFGLLPKPFIEESSRMTHSSPFLRVPIWLNYVLAKACLSPCFSPDELSIREKISMPLMRMRGSKGLNDGHFDMFLRHTNVHKISAATENQKVN